ncbi:MAG: hypothetical protein U0P45_02985 [Acidimicrobiales bacterium]
MRIEPPPSAAVRMVTRPPDTAAALPPEEPPTVLPCCHGLWVTPLSLVTLTLSTELARGGEPDQHGTAVGPEALDSGGGLGGDAVLEHQ